MRFRILVLLAGSLAAVAFALAIRSLILYGGATRYAGWSDAPRGAARVVNRVDPAGPAAGRLSVGDRLVSLDGDTLVAHYGGSVYRNRLPIGTQYRVGVERAGREQTYVLTVSAGVGSLGNRLAYLFVALVWCAVGLFIGYARSDDPVARLAFAAAGATGLVYVFPGGLSTVLPASAVTSPIHVLLGYHFFYRFPGGVRRGRVSRTLLWVFYALGLASWATFQPFNWLCLTRGVAAAAAWQTRHAMLVHVNMVAFNALGAPLGVAMVALVATTYRRMRDAEKRRRIRWVMVPSAVALSPLLLWAVLAVIDGVAKPGTSPVPRRLFAAVDLATNVGTILIPLGVAYAVVRHRVFDIAVVVRRGLQYLLARRALQFLLTVPVVALAVTVLVNRDRTIGELLSRNAAYLWLIAAAGLSLRFRQPLGRWLDRRFFREQFDREQVLVGLLGELRRVSEPAEVAPLVLAQVDSALHPSALRLWFDGDPDPPPEPLLARLDRGGGGAEAPLTTRDVLPAGVQVAVPLVSGEEGLEGVLLLGEKRSEEPYSATDLSLLGAVARETAVVHENLLLRERVSRERHIRVDVLAHLEPDRADLVKECPTCGGCFDAAERCPRDGRELELSLPVPRVVAGRYRLDQRIGRGGMGAVYEAVDLRLGRTVAIKFLLNRAMARQDALRRFRREARAVARLHHPNIVAVYDYGGLDPHGAYLVMERLRGVTLREELARHGPLSGAQAADWFAPLLDGIAAAHEEGIVHRDLKPENVVRARPEHGPPVVKILDFGLAKVRAADTISENLTMPGVVVGTFGYMSPEQLRGGDVDARSDLFAVGVMLAETLTGQCPFRGASYDAICLDYHLPDAGPAVASLDAVLQRCLATDPADRYPTAVALRAELLPALGGWPEPVPGAWPVP